MNTGDTAPLLVFNFRVPYRGTQRLVMGQLEAWYNGLIHFTGKATSGLPGYQYRGGQAIKGKGQLPPSSILPSRFYRVSTLALDGRAIRGIEGNFYPITPFEVNINGRKRGDFAIHADKNIPGSSGCIVLPETFEWIEFEAKMLSFRLAKIKEIDLIVNYILPK